MKKLFLFILFFGWIHSIYCQNIHLEVFAGIANYKGDLQYNAKSGKQISFKQPRFAASAGVEYEISNKFLILFRATLGSITADDKNQPDQHQRNLNFITPIFDVMLGLQYYILDPYNFKISPYVFAGLGYFHFNPYTYDPAGRKTFLKQLSTEGQGFVAGRDPYNLSQMAIPFGGGIKFMVNDDVRIGLEIGIRKTFTDYLDDVSSTYVDQNLLLANKGQQAVYLAFRGDEVNPAATYPTAGTPRGTLVGNDWYYFTGVTFSYKLGNGGGNGGGSFTKKSKSKLGCPVLNH